MKKFFLFTLAAITLLASCSKDEGAGGNPEDGTKAQMTLSFTLPAETRAVEGSQPATSGESKVNTLSVFIFNADGSMASTGGYTSLVESDFLENNGTYTLKDSENITTIAGNGIRIFVGINVPTSLDKPYASVTSLLAATESVANMSTGTNFAMFSGQVTENLKSVDDQSLQNGVNKVSLSVDRVVSKVVASSSAATYKIPSTGQPAWDNGMELTYTIKEFNVYNEAIQSYLPKNSATLSILNTFTAGKAKPNKAVTTPHPATGTAGEDDRNQMEHYYIGENIPKSTPVGKTLNGNTTYAMIATTISANRAAYWDTTDEVIKYETVTYGDGDGTGTTGDGADVYIVKYGGYVYVTNTFARAEKLKEELDKIDTTTPVVAAIYKYSDGWVHFQTYLNKYDDNDYRVDRNEFIHIRINSVKEFFEGQFPGYPGDPDDPTKPIDPTEETPGNPDPIDPTDPVDPEKAMLNVEITVNPWTYYGHDVELD